MEVDMYGIGGWPLVGVLLAVLVVLVGLGWWLFRRRRRRDLREELVEQLQSCADRVGLETVWQTPLFRSDVYGMRGEIEDFEIRAEMWEKSRRDFFRLSVYFPHPMPQTFRVLTRRRHGIEHLWRLREVRTGDEAFDDVFHLYTRPGDAGWFTRLFEPGTRTDLLAIADRSEGMKMGNNSLYVYVEGRLEPSAVESLIGETIAVATRVAERAVDIDSLEEQQKAGYEMASIDQLTREEPGSSDGEDFPEGTDDELVEARVERRDHAGESSESSAAEDGSDSGPPETGASDGDASTSDSDRDDSGGSSG